MEKRLACRDMGPDCSFVVCAKREEEILEEARYHARTVHRMSDIPKELKEFYDKAHSAIRDVPFCYR